MCTFNSTRLGLEFIFSCFKQVISVDERIKWAHLMINIHLLANNKQNDCYLTRYVGLFVMYPMPRGSVERQVKASLPISRPKNIMSTETREQCPPDSKTKHNGELIMSISNKPLSGKTLLSTSMCFHYCLCLWKQLYFYAN